MSDRGILGVMSQMTASLAHLRPARHHSPHSNWPQVSLVLTILTSGFFLHCPGCCKASFVPPGFCRIVVQLLSKSDRSRTTVRRPIKTLLLVLAEVALIFLAVLRLWCQQNQATEAMLVFVLATNSVLLIQASPVCWPKICLSAHSTFCSNFACYPFFKTPS